MFLKVFLFTFFVAVNRNKFIVYVKKKQNFQFSPFVLR